MARLARAEVFAPEEIAIVHVMNRVVRRCFLLGSDAVTGKNYDHRKQWIEDELKQLAAGFGIDLLGYALMSNHIHLILRSRPDVVETWDETELARRWLRLTSVSRDREPTEPELNSIRLDLDKLATIRRRLSDISWWMRLLCQMIAQRANCEDQELGKFWQSRFRAVRLLDEESLLACAAYVDLNPIRAALAETIEQSAFTSAQRRLQTLADGLAAAADPSADSVRATSSSSDSFLAPIEIDERTAELGPQPSESPARCSDKGFLAMPAAAYLELLDCTARLLASGRSGATPADIPPIFERLGLQPETWCELVSRFGSLFSSVAGRPQVVDETRSRLHRHRHYLRRAARELLASQTSP
jgi:hypothetical protein